jgi:hypothetical protein
MNADEILGRIRQTLDLPGSRQVVGGAADMEKAPARPACVAELARLAASVDLLRRETQNVGCVPQGYPGPLNLVMRTIHRLLPWYTRPIRAHAECSVAVAEVSLQLLNTIVLAQQQIAVRLEQLENEVRDIRGGSLPSNRP